MPKRKTRIERPPFRRGHDAFLDSRKPNLVLDGHAETEDFGLGKLPVPQEHVKSEDIKLLCQGEWQQRRLVATAEFLYICHIGGDDISDKVPLHEIEQVAHVDHSHDDELMNQTTVELVAFNVHTKESGFNGGRTYCFRFDDGSSSEASLKCHAWVDTLKNLVKIAIKRVAQRTLIESWKLYVRQLIASAGWQRTFGFIIFLNFIINIIQTQTLPAEKTQYGMVFTALDILFTTLFFVELLLSMFSQWFWDFFTDKWGVFDLVVVTVSVASLMTPDLPGISVLRLVRTFRVLRLFNRFRSIRVIINALASSFGPVIHSFVLVVLVCFVYAVLGVQLFRDLAPDKFGTFAFSTYTMFQSVTLDGWTALQDRLANPKYTNGPDPVPAVFFGTFIVLVSWILLPVVVAVLIDNFIKAVSAETQKDIQMEELRRMQKLGVSRAEMQSPIKPLLESLIRFKDSVAPPSPSVTQPPLLLLQLFFYLALDDLLLFSGRYALPSGASACLFFSRAFCTASTDLRDRPPQASRL